MPNRFSVLDEDKPKRTKSRFSQEASPSAKSKSRFSVLAEDSTEPTPASSPFLDTAKQAGGAILDVLSRPNYAVAGAAEELLSPQGGGLAAIPGRIGSELTSGIGDIQGQKRGFGEVMERAGVGTGGQLSDALPFLFSDSGEGVALQRGGLFDPTTRGTAGLALDILSDPLTYITFGAGGAARAGGTSLSKQGAKLLGEEVGKVIETGAARGSAAARLRQIRQAERIARAVPLAERGATEETLTLARDLARTTGIGEKVATRGFAKRVYADEATKLAEQNVLEAAKTAPHLLDQGGIKWAGRTIPGSPRVATAAAKVTDETLKALGSLPAGASALKLAGSVGRGIDSMVNLVRPGWAIRDLEGVHALGVVTRSRAAVQAARWEHLLAERVKQYALDPDALKRVAVAVDEGAIASLAGKEREAAEYIKRKGEEILQLDKAAGFDVPEVPNYLAHFYETDEPAIQRIRAYKPDRATPNPVSRHLEERVFDTLREAEAWSAEKHLTNPAIPVLKPLYDPWEALRRRGVNSIRSRNLRDFEEGLAAKYGRDAVVYDPGAAFDLAAKEFRTTTQDELTIQKLMRLEKAPNTPRQAGLAVFENLSDEGKRAFLHNRLAQAESADDIAYVLDRYREHKDLFPKQTSYAGTVAPNGQRWMPINLKGVGAVEMPERLAEYVAGLDRNILDLRGPTGQGFKSAVEVYDWITNVFKLGVTTFPAFHARNAYNNAFQSFAEVGFSIFDPRNSMDAMRILKGAEGTFTDNLGRQYAIRDLKKILEERGVIIPGSSMWEYSGKPMDRTRFRQAIEKTNAKVGGAIENEGRVAHALSLLRRGVSLEDTVASVNKTLVDYRDITDFSRKFLRRIFPFWTWNFNNLLFQYDTLMRRPGLLAAQIKPFRGRDSENRQMTTWEAGAMKIRLDGDGRHIRMITGVDLPIRNLDLLWRGSASKTALGAIGMLNPVLKTPLEMGFGKSAFTGKDFTRAQSGLMGRAIEQAPESIQRWMGYKKELDAAGRPKYTFDGERFYLLAQSWAASRLISTSDRQFRQWADDPSIGPIFLDLLTGLRYKNLDLSEEQKKLLIERQRMLERAKVRSGEAREFHRVYTPRGQ